MPNFDIIKESKPKNSFRVQSILGMFSIESDKIKERFTGQILIENEEWNIGVIYGSSGTGKSVIGRHLFSDNFIERFQYKASCVLDDMPADASVKEISAMFNSVGFSSPPSWLKPYSVLSNGEKMRVDLARALLSKTEITVFDEFTSVVDRTVAKIGSAACSKAIRRAGKKFIAVSCHDDILEWLEPDWVFCTNDMSFKITRGVLRRPKIKIEIREGKGYWKIFRKYHYLNSELNHTAKEYVAFINDNPVAFCAVLHFPHPKIRNMKRVTRLVVLPDFQGLGIGLRLMNFVAELYRNSGYRFSLTTSTPALLWSIKKDRQWQLKSYGRSSPHSENGTGMKRHGAINRITTSWEYVG